MQRTTAIAISLLTVTTAVGCGGISASSYRRHTQTLLGTRKGDITQCYDEVVKEDPSAKGKVTVKFTVKKKTGALTDIEVSKSDASEAVQNCVTENLEGLALAPPYSEDGKAKFTYKFDVASEDSDED